MDKNVNFEKSLAQLEETVSLLESGDELTLEESLKALKLGYALPGYAAKTWTTRNSESNN